MKVEQRATRKNDIFAVMCNEKAVSESYIMPLELREDIRFAHSFN